MSEPRATYEHLVRSTTGATPAKPCPAFCTRQDAKDWHASSNAVAAAVEYQIDQIANMAFFYGLVEMLVKEMPDLVWDIPFFDARDNFYQAARHGLEATVVWKEQSYLLKDLGKQAAYLF